MTIPPEINALTKRLNQELEQIEQEATEAMRIVRVILDRFPDNAILIQFFASLNNFLFFVENARRRIQSIVVTISPDDATAEDIREGGEYLATLLGVVLEARVEVRKIFTRLIN